jgi:hypothetical protein
MARTPTAKDGLHFFTILAFQRKRSGTRSSRRGGVGAYVNCWIDFKLLEGALVLAKFYIRKEGWRVRNVEKHGWVNGPAAVDRGSVRYFREAKRDGASFVFHRYPTHRRTRPKGD